MDLEQQLEVARTTVEQLTVRLIPTKKPIPETTKELVELLRQIDQYQRPRPQTMSTASGGSDACPEQKPQPQHVTTAFGVSNARPRPRTPVPGPQQPTLETPIPRPQTTTTTSGVSDARPCQQQRPQNSTTVSGVSDTRARPRSAVLGPPQPIPGIPIQRPQTTTTTSGVSDARPRQVPRPKTMTTVSGVSDARPRPQPRPKATTTESEVSNVQPRPRLSVPQPPAPIPQLPGPIPQSPVSQAALSSEKPNSQPTVRVSGFALKEEPMESLDGHHLIVKCTIEDSFHKLKSHSLVDCGASGFAFIDKDYAHHHNLPLHSLKEPRHLEVIDGRPIDSGDITHVVKVGLNINGHYEQLSAYVTKLGHYPLVLGIPWLRHHNPLIDWAKDTIDFVSPRCTTTCASQTTRAQTFDIPPRRQQLGAISIAAISLTAFRKTVKKERRLYEGASTFMISSADIDTMLAPPTKGAPIDIPEEYQEFKALFSEEEANKLPPHRPGDHHIQLKEGTTPSFGPLYSLSKHELEALRKWLDENLSKGFIRPSSSPAGSPILFVKKKDGSLRLCVDYRDLNEKTIKNRYPLPLIQETLMQLSKAKWYTKLDIRGAYNLIRMAEGDEWKTAFRTRYGLFESLVMPFGLTNAPATFQAYINETLSSYLD